MSATLSTDDVLHLVVDYLQACGLTRTEALLKKEAGEKTISPQLSSSSKLTDLLEKSYITEMATGEFIPRKRSRRSTLEGVLLNKDGDDDVKDGNDTDELTVSTQTKLVQYKFHDNDPYGASVMPLYQTATFAQPGATTFGDYDYTRSGNPTRDALQTQIAQLDGGSKCFCFSTGMSALAAVTRLVESGDEVIVNDDSYGGTYRLMSKIATRQGIRVRYVNMAGKSGPANLKAAINTSTRLVMIESPTNPMQRICNIKDLAAICHDNKHQVGTLLSIDNTMMSPILSRPIEHGADIVIHSATKFMAGHSDTMAGAIVCSSRLDGDKTLAENLYFVQNAEGTGLAPFDCWLVSRGIKTMGLRVNKQCENALELTNWLKNAPGITQVIYAGDKDHPDYDIHSSQSSGGGCVVCFQTGDVRFSEHIVTHSKLFKITVSFGSVNSLISLPGLMSHASIPADVKAAREFPADLVRISVGIEDVNDLIADLSTTMASFKRE